jgi:uncharacterized protein
MANGSTETFVRNVDTTANPAPLGLMGFGLTTFLLNLHNAGFLKLSTMILAMAIFYGGIAQVIAGIMEWRKNNTFGATAFTSYGLFWLSLVALILMPALKLGDAPDLTSTAWYFMAWGAFTFCMFIGTLRLNRALQVVFLAVAILFVLLAIRDFAGGAAGGGATWGKIAGWEGMFAGLAAVYTAVAQIWNEVYKRVVLPLGPVK